MADGGQGSIDVRDRRGVCPRRALNHQHLDAKLSRRLDLRIGGRAARVLADDERNVIVTQQVDFISQCEGPTRRHVTGMRHHQGRLDRIDAADEIMVLRCCLEWQQFLTAECEESIGAYASKGSNSAFHIRHTLPVVAGLLLPPRALQTDKRNIGQSCRLNRVCRYTGRVRVGRVHQKIEAIFHNEIGQSASTAKSAGTHRHGLRNGVTRAASHGKQQPVAGVFSQFSGQNTGICRAAKNEDGACHGL